ncbi:hypothetical protein [Streptomyces eurocidicus]|nr:hypothetical protein [Streptomyces eurocidicus]
MKVLNSLGALGVSALLVLGAGGGMAPTADAAEGARYAATNLDTGKTEEGAATPSEGGAPGVPPSPNLHCSGGALDNTSWEITCNGTRWQSRVVCSGQQFNSPVFNGNFFVRLTCPAGTVATAGAVVDLS